MNFGMLRVLNDDRVAPGRGFGTHPHQNMEIISIPLSGDLKHMDDMGNATVIKEGDIQVMSAGTGVYHSEYNNNAEKEVTFLQIWIIPNKQNVTPRYDQISMAALARENELYQILSPNDGDAGVWIHQNAWFHTGEFTVDTQMEYVLKDPSNGIYLFMLEGQAELAGEVLQKRDALGIWDTENLAIKAKKGSKLLLMEVPLN